MLKSQNSLNTLPQSTTKNFSLARLKWWTQAISSRRIADKAENPSAAIGRSEFDRDYDRVIFSSAFRRMQDKTQVYPFASTDYIRTRLTHSLEVSCVGRSLGTMAGRFLNQKGFTCDASDIGTLVAAACLAHDIGNPPFGHAGEFAVRKWAHTWLVPYLRKRKIKLSKQQEQDFLRFEGNAQSARILTRFYSRERVGGLKPTIALVGALSKYPCNSLTSESNDIVSQKKFGYFQDDAKTICSVFDQLGMSKVKNGVYARHPLAFLMEAADDICYAIVDLEDAWKVGVVDFDQARELLNKVNLHGGEDNLSYTHKTRISRLRAFAIHSLTMECIFQFFKHIHKIEDGSLSVSLIELTKLKDHYQAIKTKVRETAYRKRDVLELEAAGFKTIAGLLEMFTDAVLAKSPDKEQKGLLELLPLDYFTTPNNLIENIESIASASPYQRLLAVTDYVSGMTDHYAVDIFQRLSGIKLT